MKIYRPFLRLSVRFRFSRSDSRGMSEESIGPKTRSKFPKTARKFSSKSEKPHKNLAKTANKFFYH